MDTEGFVHRCLRNHESESQIQKRLKEQLLEIKNIDETYAEKFAAAVIEEVKTTLDLKGDYFTYVPSGVTMGEFGVGSRGAGDFYAHRKIAEVIGKTNADVGVDEMDDGGAVRFEDNFVVATVDGMHSRLSDFPFLAGFHAARATLRDVYVMGATPLGLISDVHIADDGDVAKLFEYTAGITTVSKAIGVPLIAGSTLRIGGDMVLGDRMTGCVGVVGIAKHLTARKDTAPGDVLLMTEGSGGGTISATAIYSGNADVVEETINLNFLKACKHLIESPVFSHIHAMTDVTNGGLRGDIYEIAETAQSTIIIDTTSLRDLIPKRVIEMLDTLGIDYLGVSLDSLLVIVPEEYADKVIEEVGRTGVKMARIGYVRKGPADARMIKDGIELPLVPKFRESPYTPLKKVVDTQVNDFEEMKRKIDYAAEAASEKMKRVLQMVK